jgi:hypothetical protein
MTISLDDEMIHKLLQSTWGGRLEIADAQCPGLRLRLGRTVRRWSLLHRNASGQRVRTTLGDWPVMSTSQARAAGEAVLAGRVYQITPLWRLVELYWTGKLSDQKQGGATHRTLSTHLLPLWERDVCTLRKDEILPLFSALAIWAPTHAERILAYTKAMFSWATREGLMNGNPLAKCKASEVSAEMKRSARF